MILRSQRKGSVLEGVDDLSKGRIQLVKTDFELTSENIGKYSKVGGRRNANIAIAIATKEVHVQADYVQPWKWIL